MTDQEKREQLATAAINLTTAIQNDIIAIIPQGLENLSNIIEQDIRDDSDIINSLIDMSYPVTVVEDFNFSSTNPATAKAVTLLGNYGDFGVMADSSQPEGYNVSLTTGTEYYASLTSITATCSNSTIIGNAKANNITIVGGTNNVIMGGLGNDTIHFESGGGIIADIGIGVTKTGANKTLASSTTRTATSTYVGYDHSNPDSYTRGVDSIVVNGTVTGIYFSGHGITASKKQSAFTAVIKYTDINNQNHNIVLKDIMKKPTKTNATNESKRVYQTDDVAAASLKIYEIKNGSPSQLAATALKNLFKNTSEL